MEEALEDCRSRVFSMSLVHDKLYSENHLGNLNLKEFVDALVYSMELHFGENAQININIPENINVSVSKSVPTGLILNELLTNVYKHAKTKKNHLELDIEIIDKENIITINVSDNGPGINKDFSKTGQLGLELIQSLTDQLDGEFSINNKENETGVIASLVFKQS